MTIDVREFEKLKRQVGELARLENGLGGGSSFPASPSTGALFYRTDIGFLCYYTGTLWLTVHEYHVVSPTLTVAANGNQIWAPSRTDLNPYVTRVSVAVLPAAPNNASNYWTWTIRSVNSATYASAVNVHSDNTSAVTAGGAALGNAAPNVTATPSTTYAYDLQYTKTLGAPGNLSISVGVMFRLIIT